MSATADHDVRVTPTSATGNSTERGNRKGLRFRYTSTIAIGLSSIGLIAVTIAAAAAILDDVQRFAFPAAVVGIALIASGLAVAASTARRD